jgi:hypothetical protein
MLKWTWLYYLRLSKVFLAVEVHYEHVGRLHELLLHTAGRNVYLVLMANARSSTGTCDLAAVACQSWPFLRYLLRATFSTRVGRTQPRV